MSLSFLSAPAPKRVSRCGVCDLPEVGHGRRYKALPGWHTFRAEAPLPPWWGSKLLRDDLPCPSPAWSSR